MKAIYNFEHDPLADPIDWTAADSHSFTIIDEGGFASGTISPTQCLAGSSATMWYWKGIERFVSMNEGQCRYVNGKPA